MAKFILNYTNILPKLTLIYRKIFSINIIPSLNSSPSLFILTFFINKLDLSNYYIAFFLSLC